MCGVSGCLYFKVSHGGSMLWSYWRLCGGDSASKLTVGVFGRIHSSGLLAKGHPHFLAPWAHPEGSSHHSCWLSPTSRPARVIKTNVTVLWEGSVQKYENQEAEIIRGLYQSRRTTSCYSK